MLNGTLETFALPDVLALLSATKKTGELQVNGGRGDARVWLDKGEMVGADVPRATTFVDALFEMLRLTSGNFAFENDATPPIPSGPMAVEPLLLEAQSRLGEWKSIEAVVPSLACAVRLAAEVSGGQVSITAEQWRTLVAVAMNPDVEGVMTALGLGEFDSCRMLKDLAQIGLVAIDAAPPVEAKAPAAKAPAPPVEEAEPAAPAAERPAFQTPVSDPSAFKPPVSDRPAFQPPAPSSNPPRRVSGSTLVAAARSSHDVEAEESEAKALARGAKSSAAASEPAPPSGADAAGVAAAKPAAQASKPAAAKATTKATTKAETPAPDPDGDDDNLDPAELVHQLAALQSDTPSEAPRPAAEPATSEEAETEESADTGEEPLNRGLLLKFLNSVRS